jgi:hypothetical protein
MVDQSAPVGLTDTPGSRAHSARTPISERRSPPRVDQAGRSSLAKWGVAIFMLSLVLPIVIFVGPLRLSPYRIVLLLLAIPLGLQWVSGRFGPIRVTDILILFYGGWGALALLANPGASNTIQAAGIQIVEAFGAYLVGRAFIRNREDFSYFVTWFFWIVVVMIPFVGLEAVTGHRLLSEVLRGSFAVYGHSQEEIRWGMSRAQGPFEHPILFGVFCSAGFALSYYVRSQKRSAVVGYLSAGAFACATFFSLSLGAFVSIMAQAGFIAYDKTTTFLKHRWSLLVLGTASLYVLIDSLSNRTPITIFISLASFNSYASWVRIVQWRAGTAVVLEHPILGIGLGTDPPLWTGIGVDDFWLMNAMRYGLPGLLALAAAVLSLFLALGRRTLDDPLEAACRKGFLVSLAGLCVALGTVHAWNAVFAFLMFFLGSSVWMLEAGEPAVAAAPRARAKRELEPSPGSDGNSPGIDTDLGGGERTGAKSPRVPRERPYSRAERGSSNRDRPRRRP